MIDRGAGPYFYLPKLESHLEARLWNDVFLFLQQWHGIPRGTVRATVLIETIQAAFEMEEILYELREHSAGLNAGRWDYIFSIIKTLRLRGEDYVLPDRAEITMTTPFMRSYTERLIATCHRRGAHAIGGMAAFVPNRRDPEATALALQRIGAEKDRDAADGFDGSWVAHPGLVATAAASFEAVLQDRDNQVDRLRDSIGFPAEMLDFSGAGGHLTLAGLQSNIAVSLRYLEAWLCGVGGGRHQQPDGGRGHGRDLAVAGLAMAGVPRRARGRDPRDGQPGPRADQDRGRRDPRLPGRHRHHPCRRGRAVRAAHPGAGLPAVLHADRLRRLPARLRSWTVRAILAARPLAQIGTGMTDLDTALGVILANAGLPHERARAGAYLVKLEGAHRLATMCWLVVGDHSLAVEAFFLRRPDDDPAALHAYLLARNRVQFGLAFCTDDLGDVYLVGRLPLSAIEEAEIDRLLGCVLTYSDDCFDRALELGFADAIRREWAWRTSRGESTANLAAFAHLTQPDL